MVELKKSYCYVGQIVRILSKSQFNTRLEQGKRSRSRLGGSGENNPSALFLCLDLPNKDAKLNIARAVE